MAFTAEKSVLGNGGCLTSAIETYGLLLIGCKGEQTGQIGGGGSDDATVVSPSECDPGQALGQLILNVGRALQCLIVIDSHDGVGRNVGGIEDQTARLRTKHSGPCMAQSHEGCQPLRFLHAQLDRESVHLRLPPFDGEDDGCVQESIQVIRMLRVFPGVVAIQQEEFTDALLEEHVLRKRMNYPELKRAVWQQSARFQPTNILIEDKASGTQLIQELIRDGVHGVTRYEPTMDKIMRMRSVTSTLENGFVYVPTEADWLAVYLHELTTFPACKHDDQSDSTSQALDWAKQNSHRYPLFEYYREEELRLRLNLPRDYQFIQSDEDEPITAIQERTGRTIVWRGYGWEEYEPGN
jgi:predicted phage terminase large subunit-like protein